MVDNYIALLGTKGGPAIRPGSSMPTSNLICLNGLQIILDCGLGVTKGLVDQGMKLENLSLIFISHLHSDHYIELGPLIHTAWTAGLKTPVKVFGPKPLERYWNNFVKSMKSDIDLRIAEEGRPDLRSLINVNVVKEGLVIKQNGIAVKALRTEHPPLIESFAYSFKTATCHVVFSGDTAPLETLQDFARGADLLVHEAMLKSALPSLMRRVGNASDKLMRHLLRSHTFASDAAKTARNAGVKHLALSHLIPSDDPGIGVSEWQDAVAAQWKGQLSVGYDGIRIGLSK